MKVAVLGGAGIQALGTIYDLLESPGVEEVLVADLLVEKAKERVAKIGDRRLRAAAVDLTDEEDTARKVADYDVIINSGPANLCPQATRAALRARKNYVDLGAWPEQTKEQMALHEDFKKAGITAVLGVGSAPGISNLMAAVGVEQLDSVSDIDIIIAMRDFTVHESPLPLPYALDTILDEYTEPPYVVRDGEVKRIPPLVAEAFNFEEPIGRAYPIYTIHPEPVTLFESFKDRGCKNTSFRIALPAEFHQKVKFLVELGFGSKEEIEVKGVKVSPRDVLLALVSKIPPENVEKNQYSVTRVIVRGLKNNRVTEINVELYVGTEKRWNIPAGVLKTCVPPSIVAQLLAKGLITQKGVLPPELCVPTDLFFRELAKRGMVVYWTQKTYAF